MKTLRNVVVICTLFLLPFTVSAQMARFVEGTHYIKLDTPVNTADESRIEVIELFWYGCPGCYAFEPLISQWESAQAEDIDHKRMPVVWDRLTTIHAQAFYAAESLGELQSVHQPFFEAFHENRNRLHNEVAIRELFESCGISPADFDRAFHSFSVRSRVNQAIKRIQDYGVAQTPTMYINGKYIVTTDVGGYQQMLEVVDYLVSLERG